MLPNLFAMQIAVLARIFQLQPKLTANNVVLVATRFQIVICWLPALAYPGPPNATSTIVGRDAFIDLHGNQTLRDRILE